MLRAPPEGFPQPPCLRAEPSELRLFPFFFPFLYFSLQLFHARGRCGESPEEKGQEQEYCRACPGFKLPLPGGRAGPFSSCSSQLRGFCLPCITEAAARWRFNSLGSLSPCLRPVCFAFLLWRSSCLASFVLRAPLNEKGFIKLR